MRIATSFIATRASADFQRAQIELFNAQRQAGSERKAVDLKGYEREASQLVSARGLMDRANSYAAAGEEILTRIDIQDVALGRASTAAKDFRVFLTNSVGLNTGAEVMNQLELAFFNVLGAAETTYAGKYVFGGVRDDASPVNISTLDDLYNAATVDDIFENAPRRPRVQIDPRTTMEVAPLADEVTREIFASLKRIHAYHTDTEAFGASMSANQRAFLTSEIQQLESVVEGLNQHQSLNGGVYQRAEGLVIRQAEERDYFEKVVGDIQNADLAEVAARLTQAQIQLEASARVFSVLTQSSILNYI
jgi:flagellar hook-associated protein 3 FlgL